MVIQQSRSAIPLNHRAQIGGALRSPLIRPSATFSPGFAGGEGTSRSGDGRNVPSPSCAQHVGEKVPAGRMRCTDVSQVASGVMTPNSEKLFLFAIRVTGSSSLFGLKL